MAWSRRLALLALAALPLLAGACSEEVNLPLGQSGSTGSTASAAGDVGAVVLLQYASFEPAQVTIAAGQSVEWEWQDAPIPHDVYFQNFTPAGFRRSIPLDYHSTIMITGTWYHTFTTPGIYTYICTVHAGMAGEVIVTPASGKTSGATTAGFSR
jgi:plastocyanin